MERRAKDLRPLPVEEAEERKHTFRERFRKAKPYVIAVMSTAMVASLAITASLRYGSKENLMADSLVVAISAGNRIFKDAKRDSQNLYGLKRLENQKIFAGEQEEIANFGNFEQKSALLNNTYITPKALRAIKQDVEFVEMLLDNLKRARADLNHYEESLSEWPESAYYRNMIKDINQRISAYEHNEVVLFADLNSEYSRKLKLAE